MTALVNLMVLAVIATPGVVGFLGWRRWASPSASYVRDVKRLERRMERAVASGDFSRAHMLAYAVTALAKQTNPNAPDYVVPELKSLFDHLDN